MTTPIGFKMNNPLNIKLTGDRWRGQVMPSAGDKFAHFEAPEFGIRAAVRLLTNYWGNNGINTLRGLITRWAPPSDNNPTEAYIATVAAKTDMDPDEPYDVGNYAEVLKILRAMTRVELGKPPGESWYPLETWEKGLRLAGLTPPAKSLNPIAKGSSRTMTGASASTAAAVAALATLTDLLELPPAVLELLPVFLSDLTEKQVAGIAILLAVGANFWVKYARRDDARNGRL